MTATAVPATSAFHPETAARRRCRRRRGRCRHGTRGRTELPAGTSEHVADPAGGRAGTRPARGDHPDRRRSGTPLRIGKAPDGFDGRQLHPDDVRPADLPGRRVGDGAFAGQQRQGGVLDLALRHRGAAAGRHLDRRAFERGGGRRLRRPGPQRASGRQRDADQSHPVDGLPLRCRRTRAHSCAG